MREQLRELRERHLDDVMAVIDEVLEEETPSGSNLVEMCRYHLQTGGKRLRAIIPIAVAKAFETPTEEIVAFSAACELLHNATLVHDDLQDGDETRRGEVAVWKKFGAEHAVNLGDAMFYWPILCLDRLDCPDARYRSLLRRFLRRTLDVIDGQEREFQLKRNQAPTSEDYFQMVSGKTGGLLMLTMSGAGQLSGASDEVVEALQQAGAHLGVLFQVQDDVLDLYGDKGREHRGADICEGKMSALVVHFLEHTSQERRNWLREILEADRDDVSLEQIDRVAEAFRTEGALEAALDEIERRRELAVEMPEFDEHPKVRSVIDGLAELFVAPIDHVLAERASTDD